MKVQRCLEGGITGLRNSASAHRIHVQTHGKKKDETTHVAEEETLHHALASHTVSDASVSYTWVFRYRRKLTHDIQKDLLETSERQ
jgi:hypothetical protein